MKHGGSHLMVRTSLLEEGYVTPLGSSNGHSDTSQIEITTTQSSVLRLPEGRDGLESNQIVCDDAWTLV